MNESQGNQTEATAEGTGKASTGSFTPAAPRMRKKILEKMLHAVTPIRFLDILGAEWDGDTNLMAVVRLRYKLPVSRLEELQSNLKDAWRTEVSDSGMGFTRFVDTDHGLEFRFAVIQDGSYVTGAFFVEFAEELSAA